MTPEQAGTLLHLRCEDVLLVHCDASWHSTKREDLVALARAHGGSVHGFTGVWYSPERLAAMARAVG